jgi:hypothetical protein
VVTDIPKELITSIFRVGVSLHGGGVGKAEKKEEK